MPDIQVNPLFSALPELTENDLLSSYKLMAFEDNEMKFLPLSLLSSSGWKALVYQITGVSSVQYLHLITVQELTDLILVVIKQSTSSKIYVRLGITWDQAATTELDYYDVNILTGAASLVNEPGLERISLRADAHSDPSVDEVPRLRIGGTIALNGAFILMLYCGTIGTPTFFIEEIGE